MALQTLADINREYMLDKVTIKPAILPVEQNAYLNYQEYTPISLEKSIKRAIESGLMPTEKVFLGNKDSDSIIQKNTPRQLESLENLIIKNAAGLKRNNLPGQLERPENIKIQQATGSKKKPRVANIISDVVFYLAIVVTLLATVFAGDTNTTPKLILGYSYYTVLTSSMQDVIPKGSFILVHKTDPEKLLVGDDITYMLDESTSVTHRIVGIHENYEESGARGFVTKGVNNTSPDERMVFAKDVVGKVVFSIAGLGAMILYLRANIHLVFIIFVLFIILSFCIRGVFSKKLLHNLKDSG